MSRVFPVSSRTARPRVQHQSDTTPSVRGRTPSSGPSSVVTTGSNTVRTLSGEATEEQVRQRQMQTYYEDKMKFQQKEKEKADKKRAEKFERYSHVRVGERLSQETCPTASSSTQEPESSTLTLNAAQLKIEKEEGFREQMRANRERMQKQYNQVVRNGM